jgi:hypothetical protein
MNPSDLYSNALSVLTAARSIMLTPGWQAEIDQGTSGQRLAASNELIQVQQAILALSNQSLSDIAASLQSNEKELSDATASLQDALKDITRIANVITSVSSLVQAVSKIVPLL